MVEAGVAGPYRASRQTVFVRYVLFAVIAGVVNLGSQALAVELIGSGALYVPIAVGTIAGFALKYVLDKRWIFDDDAEGAPAELRKVVIYGLFSVATTVVFWTTELAAWAIWQTPTAKYAGGALGLCIGNWAKYHLDKRWVFRRRAR